MTQAKQLERYYFTWGHGQRFPHCYHVIDAADWMAARQVMFERFGRGWCAQYETGQWFRDGVSQADEYGLIEITWPVDDSIYPASWPRCPSCGDYALDGHITCGRVECDEGAHR